MTFRPTLLLVLLGLTGGTGCQRNNDTAKPTPPGPTPVLVRVAPVEMSGESPRIQVAGVLARQTESELSFPLSGIIERITVRAGDRVKKDQELARLQRDQLEAQFEQAEATLEKARRDLVRLERLQAERVTTLESLQDARTQVEQAGAAWRIAEFNRRHAALVAPADGIILRRMAEPNENVSAGRAVLSFASEAEGWIAKAAISARDAARVALGAGVAVHVPSGPATEGKIVRIAEAADPATRSIPIEVALEGPPGPARSGLLVSLVITPVKLPERVVVPLAALREGRGGRASVFVVESGAGIARQIAVEVEEIDGDRAYLRTALPRTARVVVAGGQYVQDGGSVTVADENRAAPR